jgi:hypothetical protein
MIFAPLFFLNIPRHPTPEVMLGTIHDYYGPSIISTHTGNDVAEWFNAAGFAEGRLLPVPTSYFGLGYRQGNH